MKFGYFTLTDNPPSYGERRRDPNRFFHEVMAEAVFAEELAARTKRVLLAPGTVLLPCSHPVQVAEQFCTLDQLSGGRAPGAVYKRGGADVCGRGYYQTRRAPCHE